MKSFFIIFISLIVYCITADHVRYVAITNSSSAFQKFISFSDDFHVISSKKESSFYKIEHIGTDEDFKKLEEMGFTIIERAESRPFKEIAKVPPPSGYTPPNELHKKFSELAEKFSHIAKLIDLTETYKTPKTHDGRNIYAIKISKDVEVDRDVPNILVVSNHHARETITPEISLDAATKLITLYNTNMTIKSIVDNNQIYIMWTNNPDGLHYVWEKDNMWRKNRRRNTDNSYGVDLNRNYPAGWGWACSGSTVPSSETYRGPSSASEPETQTMVAFQKDRNFAKVIDFHSYSRDVRPGYGTCGTMPKQVRSYFDQLGSLMAKAMNYKLVSSCCMAGNIANAYWYHGSFAVLSETGTAFQPREPEMRAEVQRVWPGLLLALQLPIPLQGHVKDASNGKPIYAQVIVEGLDFKYGEKFYSNPKNGRYHWWIPDGEWTLKVIADGYQTQTRKVNTKNTRIVDFELLPN